MSSGLSLAGELAACAEGLSCWVAKASSSLPHKTLSCSRGCGTCASLTHRLLQQQETTLPPPSGIACSLLLSPSFFLQNIFIPTANKPIKQPATKCQQLKALLTGALSLSPSLAAHSNKKLCSQLE